MKTLILNGSPRPGGDTASLLRLLTEDLTGEHQQVDAYRADISPCVDCRFCWTHSGCAIQKAMGKCVMPTEGIFAVVVRGGAVRAGDEIEVLK